MTDTDDPATPIVPIPKPEPETVLHDFTIRLPRAVLDLVRTVELLVWLLICGICGTLAMVAARLVGSAIEHWS